MTFESFQAICSDDLITVGEIEGQFIYAATEDELQHISVDLGLIGEPPTIQIDLSNEANLGSAAGSPFVPVNEYWLKTAWHHLRDDGFSKMLEFLSKEDDIEEDRSPLTNCSNKLLNCVRKLSSWTNSSPLDNEVICNRYSSTSLWSSTSIRGATVHYYLPVIAIARKDDVIVIKDMTNSRTYKPLREKNQSCVTCLEWAPLSNGLLAVGVVGGVVLWNIEPNRSVSCFLPCFPGQPVTCLSWSPRGTLLACGTPTSSILIIWDVSLQTNTELKRSKGGGISHIDWSPDGGKLLVSHWSMFRVWETHHWTCECWTQLSGRCNASSWNAAGDVLIFAIEGDLSLYYVKFDSTRTSSSMVAVKCADISEYAIGPNELRVGGQVQSLAWDTANKRLAVLFSANSDGACRIAVFSTCCSPVLELMPGGFIQKAGEVPVWMGFKGRHGNGSTLVTGWDDGEITFTPLVYSQGHRLEEIKPSFNISSSSFNSKY